MSLSSWIAEKLNLIHYPSGMPHEDEDQEVKRLKTEINDTVEHQHRLIEEIEVQKQNAFEVLKVVRGMLDRVERNNKP